MTTVMAIMTSSTIMRFCGAKSVAETLTGSVSAPLVALVSASPAVAMVSGMEPERPACQTTKPL